MKIIKGSISFEATDGGEWYGYWPSVQADSWEPHTYRIFARFLDKEHSYVDIGAWIGPTVLYGCQLAKHCYAVEPDPVALKMLHKHVQINGFENVTVFEGAIGDKNGEIQLGCYAPGQRFQLGESMTSMLFGTDTFVTNAFTIEQLFAHYKIADCNFIKMDIEGGELRVLPQAVTYLEKLGVPLYLSVHFQFLSPPQLGIVADVLQKYRMEFEDGKAVSADDIRAGRVGEILVFF